MTNPTNKYSLEEYHSKVKNNCPDILDVIGYTGVDNPVTLVCKHGETLTNGYSALHRKHCCKTSYYESKKRPLDSSVIIQNLLDTEPDIDISSLHISGDGHKLVNFENLYCKSHEIYYNINNVAIKRSFVCPSCLKDRRRKTIQESKPHLNCNYTHGNSFISKTEKTWLDSLNVPIRQHWLPDVGYRVDGFDPSTNTVYLYHGRFWHGCPITYDPEYINPINKTPMKELYARTLLYEDKIRQQGYNLITTWGT